METLLEREAALRAVDDALDSARRGDGAVVLVGGPAGVGKTAVLEVARERAGELGFAIGRARGDDLERPFAFGVVRQLFDRLVTAGPDAPAVRGAAALALPLLTGEPAASSAQASHDGPSGQAAGPLMHGLYWLLVSSAAERPVLLCVDDAHWSDTASLEWLGYLARRIEGLPVALIVSSRAPETDEPLLGALAAADRGVALEALSRSASDALVRRTFGARADDEFCAACHAVTGGNPFLLRELTRALAQDGVEPASSSAGRVRELVPDTIARWLVLRLARLPAEATMLARAVAILGQRASLRAAGALAEQDVEAVAETADALAAAGILAPELPLTFVHPLLRAAIYGEIPAGRRSLLHARAARVLASGGAPAESVASHILRCEPAADTWVVERLRDAANAAIARGDPRTAVACLRRAVIEPVEDSVRLALLQELVKAGYLAFDPLVVEGLGVDVVGEIAADPDALRAAAVPVVMQLWSSGRAQEALEILERAIADANAVDDRDTAVSLEVRLIALAQLKPADALARLEPYGQTDEPRFGTRLRQASEAWFGCFAGRPVEWVRTLADQAFSDALLLDGLRDDDLVLGSCVLGLIRAEALERAGSVVADLLRDRRARGSAAGVASALYLSAQLAYLRGDVLGAEADARAAIDAFGAAGVVGSVPIVAALLVQILVDRGQLEEASSQLASVAPHDVPDHWWFLPLLWSRAQLRLAEAQTRQGLADLLEFGRRSDAYGIVSAATHRWGAAAAPLLFQLDAREEARRLAQRQLDEARAWGTPRAVGEALVGVGLVSEEQDRFAVLREAVQTLEGSPGRLEHTRALVELGAALRRANQRTEARQHLRRALDEAHRRGARRLADQAAQELRATGARPRSPVLSGLDALTASERRVAEMAAQGLSNREIAEALFVSIKTIETHMRHVFQKLDTNSRKQLLPLVNAAS